MVEWFGDAVVSCGVVWCGWTEMSKWERKFARMLLSTGTRFYGGDACVEEGGGDSFNACYIFLYMNCGDENDVISGMMIY